MSILNYLNPFQNSSKDEEKQNEIILEQRGTQAPSEVTFITTTTDDPKIREHFDKLMETSNLPGPDFYEFGKAVKQSGNLIPENILFQTIFNTFKSLGVNKNILLSSIDEYITVINNDKTEFEKTIAELEKTQITAKQNQIEANKAKINDMQLKINELTQINFQIQNELTQTNNELTSKVQNYNSTYLLQIQELNNDKQKINQYINE